jgi:chromosomal replication initiator protein
MPTFSDCVTAVAQYRRVDPLDIKGHSRARPVAYARQEAVYFARKYTNMSLPQIGRLANRHHTSIIHSVQAVEERCECSEYRAEIEDMRRRLVPRFYRHTALIFKSRRTAQ